MRNKIVATFTFLIASLALAIAVPGSAHAAMGTFGYYTTSWQVLTNPANGVCHSFNGTAALVRNNTDTPAVIYQDFHCQTPIGAAAVGVEVTVLPSGSVTFGV